MTDRILVADDDDAILEGMRLILEDEGYEVITTRTGPTIESVIEERPALIFLDIWMSGLDGRNVCAAIKSDKRTHGVPVILSSANIDVGRFAKECGADDILTKPFELDEVLRLAERYVRSTQGGRRG